MGTSSATGTTPPDPARRSSRLSQDDFEESLHRRHETRHRRNEVPDASRVRSGLQADLLDNLVGQLNLSQEALAEVIGVSSRTLQRRRSGKDKLTPAESDRVWRLLHVWDRAHAAFGSTSAARAWMTEAKGVLGGESPVERLDTEPGLREVEDMLNVIDETGAA